MTITDTPPTAIHAIGTGAQTGTARLTAIVDDVQAALAEIIARHRVTYEEYRVATEWLTEAGTQDFEIPLLLDVFLATAVDDASHASAGGTDCNVEGPVYFAGAPRLERPYVLPQRADEPGEKLTFSGTVRLTDGTPVSGAVLDVWQANGLGEYSNLCPDVPEYNLRGKLTTDQEGRYSFGTVVPSQYPIPVAGATGRLLAGLGRSAFRPGHIHFKFDHPAAAPLTTQIYFEGDPHLASDVVGAVKDSLVVTLAHHDDGRGGSRATCSYDFVLSPAAR